MPKAYFEFVDWLANISLAGKLILNANEGRWKGPNSLRDFETGFSPKHNKSVGVNDERQVDFNHEMLKILVAEGITAEMGGGKFAEIVLERSSNLVVRDGWVASLTVHGDIRMDLANSWIGRLTFASGGSATMLKVSGGGILEIVQSDVSADTFTGDVAFENVFIPRFEGPHSRQQLQPLRTLRSNLIRLRNYRAAGIFHGVELALERKRLSWIGKIVNWLYEVGSDYGTSIKRPVFWFLFLWATSATLGWVADSILWEGSDAQGWHRWLQMSSAFRSFIYPITLIVNPFGIVTSAPQMYAANPWIAITLTLNAILMALAAALFFLSIRRSFKLE